MSSSAPSRHGVVVPVDDSSRRFVPIQSPPEQCRCPCPEQVCGVFIVIGLILFLLGPIYIFDFTFEMVNTFKDPQFQVDSFSFSCPSLYTSRSNNIPITANWSIGILVRNAAKHHGVAFENIEVSVLYHATKILSTATIETFHEVPKNETSFTLHPRVWLESSVAGAIANDTRDAGVVDFDLRVRANSTYTMKITHGKYNRIFDAYCRNLKVGFSSNATDGGMMLGGSKHCYVAGALEMHPR